MHVRVLTFDLVVREVNDSKAGESTHRSARQYTLQLISWEHQSFNRANPALHTRPAPGMATCTRTVQAGRMVARLAFAAKRHFTRYAQLLLICVGG